MNRAFAWLAALALLSGCTIGPRYVHPQTPVPAAWDAKLPGAASGFPAADWWKAYGSPQLDRLIAQAQSGNLDIAAASARIEQADAQAREAGAALLPQIGVGANAGAARQLSLLGHERHHIFEGGTLQASYQLDFWGKNRSAALAAHETAQAARFDAQVVALSTAASVAGTYFSYLGLQQQLAIAQDNLRRERDTLAGLTTMQQAGSIPALSVAQQQTLVDSLVATLAPLAQQAEHLHTALAILVGVLPEALQLQPETLSSLSDPVVSGGLPSQLLVRRPDVQSAEARLKADNANIRVARAAFFPSLDLTANGGIVSYALSHYTVPPLGIYSLAASLSQPIFEGGMLRAQLQYARATNQADLQAYAKTALQAFGDVEDALTDLKQTADEQQAQADRLRSAQSSLGMAQDAFHGGTTTLLDTLTAEGIVVSAQDSLAQARVAHLQAQVALYSALGGGWIAPD